MTDVKLAVWSGPRNISTALMRSWENRPDTKVVDEPLYGFYLDRTRLDHPGRDEVIAAMGSDWEPVVADLTAPYEGVYYQKHMTHHLLPELPREWIGRLHNVLLIRDPAEVVASYTRERANVVATDIGLVQQAELYDRFGGELPVIDSADFLQNPEAYLRFLCDYIGVAVHRRDAALAGRPARVRRPLGEVLVRRGRGVDRVRTVPSARGHARGRGARGGRGESAVLRAAARRARRAAARYCVSRTGVPSRFAVQEVVSLGWPEP